VEMLDGLDGLEGGPILEPHNLSRWVLVYTWPGDFPFIAIVCAYMRVKGRKRKSQSLHVRQASLNETFA
jgi:hypothetical protein